MEKIIYGTIYALYYVSSIVISAMISQKTIYIHPFKDSISTLRYLK